VRPVLDIKDARKTAFYILDRLRQRQSTLDAIMADAGRILSAMTSRDRALTQTIVYGVLRWQRRLDAYIAYFSKTNLKRVDPVILNLLRIGMFQILYLDRVPSFAAVTTTVQMAKAHAPTWVVRYVNGLLREAVRKHADLSLPVDGSDPIKALCIQKSFPTWLIQRWLNRFGEKETLSLCDAINKIPKITIRVNTLKNSRQQVLELLKAEADSVLMTRYSPLGLQISNLHRAVDQMPSFKWGAFQVQDEAAQLVTQALDPKPGETILDACAGLGGKTGHIAQAMDNQGHIVAADRSSKKLHLLQREMKRLGVHCVKIQNIDWNRADPKKNPPKFDRVLVDAPCSGIGVMRRNPDIKWQTGKANLDRYGQRQIAILSNMAPLVKLKGIVIYSVCSFEPEENEFVINGFLKNHSEFAKEDIGPYDCDEIVNLGCENGFLRTFPHHHAMDGFFIARLRKIR
jgi:16S rRNA (cytosine967-C5)-methyltransferase